MALLLNVLASLIECVAKYGAGVASVGCGYQPELPEELRK